MSETVRRRTIGAHGPEISQITYGTMRLRGTVDEAADHLRRLHDLGITTHHSSHEYDSHGLYLQALANARADRSYQHIVKLSSPSFDNDRFDATTIRRLVESELRSLGTDQLSSVQWLVRTSDAQDLQTRLSIIEDQRDEIHSCFAGLIASGDIADVSVFTYHPDFTLPAVAALPTRTVCDYLNLSETELAAHLDNIDSFLAIRPLAAGTLTADVRSALRWPLLHPKVATIILSVNDPGHVNEAVDAAGHTVPDQARFGTGLHLAEGTK